MKTERLKEIVKEAAIIGVLAISGYTTMNALQYATTNYRTEKGSQQECLEHLYPELDLGNLDWAKYLLIR